MIEKLKMFLFDKFAGKIVARMAVTMAAAVASGPVAAMLAKMGIVIAINDAELATGMIALAHAAYEMLKAKMKAPAAAPAQPKA